MAKLLIYGVLGFLATVVLMLVTYGVAKLVGVGSPGDYFSLAQLGVDLVLSPLVILSLFYTRDALMVALRQLEIAIDEVRRLEAKPQVDLFFEGNVKETELIKPRPGGDWASWPKLILFNSGNAIARWYSVEMTFPDEIAPSEQAIRHFLSDSGLGLRNPAESDTRGGNWFYRHAWRPDGPPLFSSLSFRSDGTYAIYINHPLELIVLNIFLKGDREYAERYEVPYLIASDWGAPVQGKLVFRVVNQET